MRIRPGRTRSLFAGIVMLLVTVVGLVMMSQFGGPTSGLFGPFVIIWVVIGLAGAAMSFYNALSEEGLPIYELDLDEEEEDEEDEDRMPGGPFCPQCGRPVDPDDQFCRSCGRRLVE